MTAPLLPQTRIEHDLLGARTVPAEVYYGVHTARAAENFPITGTPISSHPDLIYALASVKHAAAWSNERLGLLNPHKAEAIANACNEIRSGLLHEHFVVDVLQGGAGTSSNMNANEVIANRGLELMGRARGDYHHLHPISDVNMGQSTNDVYPTAIKVALQWKIKRLRSSLAELADAFDLKAAEFADHLKMGRTQLQDAVPMTLGQEFRTYAIMMVEDSSRLGEAAALCGEINLGGTAIGTGLNAHPDYCRLASARLGQLTGLDLVSAPDLVEATQDAGSFVQISGVLKRTAVKLGKICNDLRLLSSGPRAGFNEINLPPVQAGSSIMPGKVNPVIPEAVNQVAFEIIGNDVTITMAAQSGQLQLNAFEPVIAHKLFEGIDHLDAVCTLLAGRCIAGITANAAHMRSVVEHSIGLITALAPAIGYDTASALAQSALDSNRSVVELAIDSGALSRNEVDLLLDPRRLAGPLPPVPPGS